ncbi:hypothetical protein CC1G_07449 [Coprinopsis cinerea okayama7|uniref:Uncharacterized protein n=1 Tax=Coprinopsis cinerea (strain Okayama-7 / 130 / ATCC MYA-4618 / FGSC 9003) TaxID=240176 RepID=A8NB78_COPC7|nr:hypothetical protein CC1G_07449 [Coprinopsis cinerea okayama7\|eukprot:XP_001832078.2 hypothetical protein CC1G_07449 [Coprinopsis cinerea okayama7\
MSSIVLAEEILDLLVDILGSEYTLTSPSSLPLGPKELGTVRALGSLSLASRRLASRCRVHRFWKLTFHADTWPGLTAPPPYREDAIQRTVTLFRDNPRLFWYVRDIDVVFRREGGDPFHFLQSLHSFLPNVHNVDTMALRVPGSPRRWSEFDKLTQAALLQCINQNPLARMLRVDGIRLPENILKILPSSLGGLRLHGSGGIDAPISQCPILAPETKCRPEELQISISDPFTRIMMEQEPSFFSRLARLDVFIHGDSINLPIFHRLLCDPHLLVTTNVHTLDLSYHGSDVFSGVAENSWGWRYGVSGKIVGRDKTRVPGDVKEHQAIHNQWYPSIE